MAISWTIPSPLGSINPDGLFTAGTVAGTYESAVSVEATQGPIVTAATATLTVLPGPLSTVAVEPNQAMLDIRADQLFTFTALDEFGNEVPVETVSWSALPSVGVIDTNGVLTTGILAGTAVDAVAVEVADTMFTRSASAKVTIVPGPVDSVSLSPERVKLVPGDQQQFQAITFDAFGNETTRPQVSWEAGAGTIDADGLFTAGSVPGRYLKDIKVTATENETELVREASVDIPFSGFGTAIIDGRMDPGEWDNATYLDFTMTVAEGTVPATIFVMNDETDLYLAIRAGEVTDRGKSVTFQFDNNLDGVGEGEDRFTLSTAIPGTLLDLIKTSKSPCDPGFICNFLDVDQGGTNDGVGMISDQGGYTVFESSHPLDSADDEHDFNIKAGDSIGFSFRVALSAATTFPEVGSMEIVIASKPPPEVHNFIVDTRIPVVDGDVFGLIAGDVVGDGQIRVIVGSDTGDLYVFQHRNGSYIEEWRTSLGGEAKLIIPTAVGDVDNDGQQEFLVTAWSPRSSPRGNIYMYKRTGDTYHLALQQHLGGNYMPAIIVDLNRDGENELVIDTGRIIVYQYSMADSIFVPVWVGPDGDVLQISFGDVDGDGEIEVIAAFPWAGEGRIMIIGYNQGQYQVEATITDFPYALSPTVAADLDNDGTPEIVTATFNVEAPEYPIFVVKHNGDAYVVEQIYAATMGMFQIHAGDIDGDGLAEASIIRNARGLFLVEYDSIRGYRVLDVPSGGSHGISGDVADTDGDGRDEILVGRSPVQVVSDSR